MKRLVPTVLAGTGRAWGAAVPAALAAGSPSYQPLSTSPPSGSSPAVVERVWRETEQVKCFTLRVEDDLFHFKPGQWVDTFIPGVPVVGGFSLCSSPRQLHALRTVELGVQWADSPPARWFHEECRAGSKLHLKVGGDFYLDYSPSTAPFVLMVGGGVGINPLASMFRHAASAGEVVPAVSLLYSARNEADLLYRDDLARQSASCPSLSVQFYVTRQQPSADSSTRHGRITKTTLTEALQQLCNNSGRRDYSQGRRPTRHLEEVTLSLKTEKLSLSDKYPHAPALVAASSHASGSQYAKGSKKSSDDENSLHSSCRTEGRPSDGSCRTEGRPSDGSCCTEGRPSDGSCRTEGRPSDGSCTEGRPSDRSCRTEDISSVLAYVCGPPDMISDMERYLLELGLEKQQLRYEKWW